MMRRAPRRQAAGAAIVVDASLVVKLIAREEDSDKAEAVLLDDRPLLAPDFLLLEVANAFWKKLRRREWDGDEYQTALAALRRIEMGLVATETLAYQAAILAAEHNHPVYDCAYVALAQSRGGAIATFDERLKQLAESTDVALWESSSRGA